MPASTYISPYLAPKQPLRLFWHNPVRKDLILHVVDPVFLGHQATEFILVIFIIVHAIPVVPGQPAYEFLSGRVLEELVQHIVRFLHDAVVSEAVFIESGHALVVSCLKIRLILLYLLEL